MNAGVINGCIREDASERSKAQEDSAARIRTLVLKYRLNVEYYYMNCTFRECNQNFCGETCHFIR